jgi:hypothetical protein
MQEPKRRVMDVVEPNPIGLSWNLITKLYSTEIFHGS